MEPQCSSDWGGPFYLCVYTFVAELSNFSGNRRKGGACTLGQPRPSEESGVLWLSNLGVSLYLCLHCLTQTTKFGMVTRVQDKMPLDKMPPTVEFFFDFLLMLFLFVALPFNMSQPMVISAYCDGTAITRKFTYFYITAPTLTSNSMVINKHHLPEHEI